MDDNSYVDGIINAYKDLLKDDKEKACNFLGEFFSSIDKKFFGEYREELGKFLISKSLKNLVETLELLKFIKIPENSVKLSENAVTDSYNSSVRANIEIPKVITPKISKKHHREIIKMSHSSLNPMSKQVLRFIDQKNNSIAELEVIEGKSYLINPRIDAEVLLRIACFRGKVLIQESANSFEMSVCCNNRMRIYKDQFVLIEEFRVRFVKKDDLIACKYSVNDKDKSKYFSKSVNFGINDKGNLDFNIKTAVPKGVIEKNGKKWEIVTKDNIYRFLHTKDTKGSKFSLPLLVLDNMQFKIQDTYFRAVFSSTS